MKLLSSYNLFNYLFPGVIFSILVEKFTSFSLLQEDLIIGAFLYYFIGLVISRIGSLIIEPLIKKIKFVKYADYSDYLNASKKDEKITVLSEQNNMFRTIIAMLILLLLVKLYDYYKEFNLFLDTWSSIILIILLLILFTFSYKKQVGYIKKRISLSK
jgi:hypothetical protein